MIYYNGFNMLVDLILGLAVWFFTYRFAWMDGYIAGAEDAFNATEEDRLNELAWETHQTHD